MRKNTEALSVSHKDVGVELNIDKLITDVHSQEQLMTLAAHESRPIMLKHLIYISLKL